MKFRPSLLTANYWRQGLKSDDKLYVTASHILSYKDSILEMDDPQDRFTARLIKKQLEVFYVNGFKGLVSGTDRITYCNDEIREICLKIVELCVKAN